MQMRDDDYLTVVSTDELNQDGIYELVREDLILQQLIEDFDAESVGKGFGAHESDDAGYGPEGTPVDESSSYSPIEVICQSSLAKEGSKEATRQRQGKRIKLTVSCEKQSRARTQRNGKLTPPSEQSEMLKTTAENLRKLVEPFSSLSEESIIRLLQQGAQLGIQPKVPSIKAFGKVAEQVTYQEPKRASKLRGAYKQKTKDSWTSCVLQGESGTILQNATETKRNPIVQFQERIVTVNDIKFCQESAGEVEV